MWYVVHTMAGLEQKCMQQCQQYVDQADYSEMFIPLYMAKKHFRKEWHDVEQPLFPGYFFIDTKDIQPIQLGLKHLYQYTKVLQNGEIVSPITKEEQNYLEKMMDRQHIVQYSEGFLIGDEVLVTSGPIRNCKGWIKSVDRHWRVAKMEIPIFGRRTPVEIGFGAIARVSKQDFKEMIADNIAQQEQLGDDQNRVKVVKGVFKDMTGHFLYADTDRDEWTVELKLFDNMTKVMFQRDEIKMLL